MGARKLRLTTSILLALAGALAVANEIPRDSYLNYLPLDYPKLIRETDANRELRIYGDAASPEYRDQSPRDGIDDRRGELFRALALRFAPYVVRNTSNFPMDFEKVQRIQDKENVTIDHWDVSGPEPRLQSTETIDLRAVTKAPCPAQGDAKNDDCRLLSLLKDFSPTDPQLPWLKTPTVGPKSAPFAVPFVDFLGDSPESWQAEYTDPETKGIPEKYQGTQKTYVHPLATARSGQDGKYDFVLQYWFFYPQNDADNKHKGDWEHINVYVTPLSRLGQGLTADELRALFTRSAGEFDGPDPLVMDRVDYYFHSFVMTVDFSAPNAYLPRVEWNAQMARFKFPRAGGDRIARLVREEAWADPEETKINTHPVAYVGADSKGISLVLYPPGARNRDGHGTYPFTGLYKDIGPASAAEEINKNFVPRKNVGKPLPDDVILFDRPDWIELIPDWERIIGMSYRETEARRHWYWLLVPMRWGYPAIESKFAGIVEHAETGNIASLAPPFNSAWNRPGPGDGTSAYVPQQLVGVFPISPLDSARNNWGWINAVTIPMVSLPPFDLIFKFLAIPVRAAVGFQTNYYPGATLPYRYFSLSAGGTFQTMNGEDWSTLFANNSQVRELLARVLAVDPAGGRVTRSFADDVLAPVYQLHFYLGPHFVSENSLRHSSTALGVDVATAGRADPILVRGNIDAWEFAGSIRYNLLTERTLPFVKLGYGWNWYRLTDVSTDGAPISTATSPWFKKPGFFHDLWPSEWLFGAGLEYIISQSRHDLFHGVGFSARLDLSYTTQTIDVPYDAPGGLGLVPPSPTTHRFGINLCGVINF